MVEDHRQLVEYLESVADVSLQNSVNNSFRKTLVISAASYYESQITEVLVGLYRDADGRLSPLSEFVKNEAIGRRYSQLFAWTDGNANRFFRSFGGNFRAYMTQRVNKDSELKESIEAFLTLGDLRNQIVHGNFAVFVMDKSVEDIIDLFEKAKKFVEGLDSEIREYMRVSN